MKEKKDKAGLFKRLNLLIFCGARAHCVRTRYKYYQRALLMITSTKEFYTKKLAILVRTRSRIANVFFENKDRRTDTFGHL